MSVSGPPEIQFVHVAFGLHCMHTLQRLAICKLPAEIVLAGPSYIRVSMRVPFPHIEVIACPAIGQVSAQHAVLLWS